MNSSGLNLAGRALAKLGPFGWRKQGDTVALLDNLLWPPTQVAAAGSQATATWRPQALRWE